MPLHENPIHTPVSRSCPPIREGSSSPDLAILTRSISKVIAPPWGRGDFQ